MKGKNETIATVIFLCMCHFMAIMMGTAFYLKGIMEIYYYIIYCILFTIYIPLRIKEVLKK